MLVQKPAVQQRDDTEGVDRLHQTAAGWQPAASGCRRWSRTTDGHQLDAVS